jgi:hypothetical protein
MLNGMSDKVIFFNSKNSLMDEIKKYEGSDLRVVVVSEIMIGKDVIAGFDVLEHILNNKNLCVVYILLTKNPQHVLLKSYKIYEMMQEYVVLIKPISEETIRYTIRTHFDIIIPQGFGKIKPEY